MRIRTGAATAVPRPELASPGLGGNPITSGSGWWGQFTSGSGGFNARNAEAMRTLLARCTRYRQGELLTVEAMVALFPYPPVACRGEIGAFINHLRALLLAEEVGESP